MQKATRYYAGWLWFGELTGRGQCDGSDPFHAVHLPGTAWYGGLEGVGRTTHGDPQAQGAQVNRGGMDSDPPVATVAACTYYSPVALGINHLKEIVVDMAAAAALVFRQLLHGVIPSFYCRAFVRSQFTKDNL